MKGMNLSKFKKMKEDADWAVMIHEDGHLLHIAKAPLNHLHKKQLEALPYYAKGGKIGSGFPPLEVESLADSNPLQVESIGDPQSQQAQAIPAPAAVQNPSQVPAVEGAQAPATQSSPLSPLQGKSAALQAEQEANTAAAATEQQKAKESVEAYDQVENRIKQLPTQTQVLNKHKAGSDRLLQDYASGKLDPDRYWKDHSKVTAGIGVLLSSLGQALGSGGENAALENIKLGVNRDIEHQKNEQDKRMNLWKMNREILGDDLSANLAAQNQLYTGLQYKTQKAAAKSTGPLAVANAQKLNAQLEQLKAENNFKISLMNPTSDNPDPTTRVNILVPQHQQAEAFKEIKQRQYIVENTPAILAAFDEAGKDTRFLGGHTLKAITPGYHTPGQNKFMGLVAPTVPVIEGNSNQQTFSNLDDRFTPHFSDSVEDIAGKRLALIEYLRGKDQSPVTKGSGIDLNKFPSTDTSRIGQQGAPGAEKPDQVKQNGHSYRLNRATGKYE